jgi:TRAP-type C4-dicarboxylate transport system permease large subunit
MMVLIERTIKWCEVLTILKESAQLLSMIMMMIIGSVVLGGIMSVLEFTEQIVDSVLGVNVSGSIVVFPYDSAYHSRNCEQ